MHWYLSCFRNYATFTGRARRKEYWMFILFNVLLFFAWIILFIPLLINEAYIPAFSLSGIYGLYLLAAFVPYLAVTVRRLHDTNHSGWWLAAFWGAPFLIWTVQVVAYISLTMSASAQGMPYAYPALSGVSFILDLGGLALSIVQLVFLLKSGTIGENKYGPDPKSMDGDQGIDL
jgi:uncharacterized membrane protein YhaH (DUF805 family)